MCRPNAQEIGRRNLRHIAKQNGHLLGKFSWLPDGSAIATCTLCGLTGKIVDMFPGEKGVSRNERYRTEGDVVYNVCFVQKNK